MAVVFESDRNIILIGPSGAGKSSTGTALAGLLGWPCLDSDKHIETAAGKTIRLIFQEDGEPAFRKMENELLDSLCHSSPTGLILACGGGLPVGGESAGANLEKLKALGLTIYLTASVKTLAARIEAGEAETRPLIGRLGNEAELKSRLTSLLSGRRAIYEKAHLTIDTENKTVSEVAATIQRIVRKRTL